MYLILIDSESDPDFEEVVSKEYGAEPLPILGLGTKSSSESETGTGTKNQLPSSSTSKHPPLIPIRSETEAPCLFDLRERNPDVIFIFLYYTLMERFK